MVFHRDAHPGEVLARAARRAGVADERVLEALARVDRRAFVPRSAAREAAQDAPVPIGQGQTTSQPSLIALMVEGLGLRGHERVLEIGGGYGYQTALLAELAAEVWSVERYGELAEAARANLAAHGADNANVVVGDGTAGLADAAPFDAMVVSAASPRPSPAWVGQLVEEGPLVAPLGDRGFQEVVRLRRRDGELVRDRELTPVRFVPLVPDE